MRTEKISKSLIAPLLACAVTYVHSAFAVAAASAGTLSFSVVPQRDIRETFEVWHPILDDLETRSGLSFLLTPCGHFEDHLKHLRNGSVDLVYTNPYFAKIAIKSGLYTPLVRNADDLEGVVVVHEGSPIKNLTQLRDHEVAFPSPYAFAAYLLPRRLFETNHIQIKPRFVENQASVLLNVALRQVSAGAVAATIFETSDRDVRAKLRVLAHTPRTSAHPILVRKSLAIDQRKRLLNALREMEATSEGHRLLSQIPITRLTPANDREYLALPDLVLPKLESHESPP